MRHAAKSMVMQNYTALVSLTQCGVTFHQLQYCPDLWQLKHQINVQLYKINQFNSDMAYCVSSGTSNFAHSLMYKLECVK